LGISSSLFGCAHHTQVTPSLTGRGINNKEALANESTAIVVDEVRVFGP
jgi:hypothetical protein